VPADESARSAVLRGVRWVSVDADAELTSRDLL
jgi:hypothetical protein